MPCALDFVEILLGVAIDDLGRSMQSQSATVHDSWPLIEDHLPANFREEAVRIGLIAPQSEHLKTKVRDIADILRLVLMMVGHGFSLRVATATSAGVGHLAISAVALHKWMRNLGDYLMWLLAEVSKCSESFRPQRWGGYDIIATDATTVERPGAKGTTARVHVALRLSNLRCLEYKITSDKSGEHLGGFESMEPGQLWIGDRGYATSSSIEHAHSKGAAVLIRYNRSSLPLFRAATDEQPIDVAALLRRSAKVGEVRSAPVYIKPKQGPAIQGYLHFRKMSKNKAERAQAKLHRERKKAGRVRPSETALQLATCHIVFTTAPQNRIPASDCLELYRLRWQIELHNKREKSIGGLGGLPNFRQDTIQTWITAKLLLTQLCMKMVESSAEFSPSDVAAPPKKRKKSASLARSYKI